MSPLSMTTRTPSIVSDVSAIEVASTILRRPAGAGATARSWARPSSAPYSGAMSTSVRLTRASKVSAMQRISPCPGRKTRIEPLSLASASSVTRATSSSMRALGLRPTYRVATGKARPWLSISGASPRSARTRAPSSVADITSSLKSSRKPCCASSAKARPRSASSERS